MKLQMKPLLIVMCAVCGAVIWAIIWSLVFSGTAKADGLTPGTYDSPIIKPVDPPSIWSKPDYDCSAVFYKDCKDDTPQRPKKPKKPKEPECKGSGCDNGPDHPVKDKPEPDPCACGGGFGRGGPKVA